jgi:hypothetical protein
VRQLRPPFCAINLKNASQLWPDIRMPRQLWPEILKRRRRRQQVFSVVVIVVLLAALIYGWLYVYGFV